jgi:hypothetical protein
MDTSNWTEAMSSPSTTGEEKWEHCRTCGSLAPPTPTGEQKLDAKLEQLIREIYSPECDSIQTAYKLAGKVADAINAAVKEAYRKGYEDGKQAR